MFSSDVITYLFIPTHHDSEKELQLSAFFFISVLSQLGKFLNTLHTPTVLTQPELMYSRAFFLTILASGSILKFSRAFEPLISKYCDLVSGKMEWRLS